MMLKQPYLDARPFSGRLGWRLLAWTIGILAVAVPALLVTALRNRRTLASLLGEKSALVVSWACVAVAFVLRG